MKSSYKSLRKKIASSPYRISEVYAGIIMETAVTCKKKKKKRDQPDYGSPPLSQGICIPRPPVDAWNQE